MEFTNLTRANEIGANCYHLKVNGTNFLLDSGSHPKIEGNGGLPKFDLISGKHINAVFVTHGHLDHLGSLPVVLGDHPEARAYISHASSKVAERALHNSASVMIKQRSELNLPELPLFTHGQVDRITDDFQIAPLGRSFDVDGAKITFHEAGHVLGATGVWIQAGDESLFYTGDAKFSDMKITRAAKFPDQTPTTLVMECTRGNTPSQPTFSWDREIERLARSIQETFEKGGSVLIPCFALGKTQEVLKVLYDLMQEGVLQQQPIYISGLAHSYNEIYDELANQTPRVCPGFKLEKSLDLTVLERREGLTMKIGRGRLMVVSSGMMTSHTASYMLTQRMASDENHSIFFVGYVDPDSPAGKVKAAGSGRRADMGGDVGELDIRCRVESFDFTSHCNREHMLDYVNKVRPKNVLLVHGELASLEWFRQQINQSLPETKVIVPASGETLHIG
jgi:Cft2 family RNA processing exonuclease